MFGFGVNQIYPKILRPKYLLKAEYVKQFPSEECKQNSPVLRKKLTSTNKILCTYDRRAASPGDSGGPAVIKVRICQI